MKERIIRLVSEVCWVNPGDIRADRELVDYGLDSARALDLLVAIEEAFDVEISDDVAARLRTVSDIVRHIQEEKGP